ncbi:MAG TPA: MDR family MFS transporter [Acidimicrobiales bacterium]|nr:MDR family MFS transporter [Acidimicrobiales bacterium]
MADDMRRRLAALPSLPPKVAVSVVFVLAMFMAIMDVTIVNVALPTLARQFRVRPAAIDTVVVGFLVSLAVFIPASGWLGDRFGTKRVFLAAVAVFTGASALCGLAQNLGELVGFRILQGVGGGMMTPVGMAMLYRTFPAHERIRASRILTAATAFAPALGPVIGGLFVTDFSWRWVFFVNLPIGLVALTFGSLFLAEHTEPDAGAFDVAGFLLAGVGFASLMYCLSEGSDLGWGSPRIVVSGTVGAALTALLVRVELRRPHPMIDLRLFSDKLFRATSALMFLGVSAFLGSLYIVALFFQLGLGASPLTSGLSTFPEAIGVMLGAQVSTRLYPKVGPRRIIVGGLLFVSMVLALISRVGAGPDSLWIMRGLMFVLGYGMAHVFTPAQAAAFATIRPSSTGRASTLFNAQRQLGSALGVAVLSTVFAAVGPFRHTTAGTVAHLSAYHDAFALAAVMAAVAAVAALFVNDALAAPSMRDMTAAAVPEGAIPEPAAL